MLPSRSRAPSFVLVVPSAMLAPYVVARGAAWPDALPCPTGGSDEMERSPHQSVPPGHPPFGGWGDAFRAPPAGTLARGRAARQDGRPSGGAGMRIKG